MSERIKKTRVLDYKCSLFIFPILQKVYWGVIKPTIEETGMNIFQLQAHCVNYGLVIKDKNRFFDLVQFEDMNPDSFHFFMIMLNLSGVSFEYALSLTYSDIDKIFIFAQTQQT